MNVRIWVVHNGLGGVSSVHIENRLLSDHALPREQSFLAAGYIVSSSSHLQTASIKKSNQNGWAWRDTLLWCCARPHDGHAVLCRQAELCITPLKSCCCMDCFREQLLHWWDTLSPSRLCLVTMTICPQNVSIVCTPVLVRGKSYHKKAI